MQKNGDAATEAPEIRLVDEEAAEIAVERIRSGTAECSEDGIEALAKLGIRVPDEAGRRGRRRPTA